MPLIDTNVAVHMRDGTGGMRDRVTGLTERPRVSIMTWVELEGGVPAAAQARRGSLDALLRVLEVLPCDAATVRSYAEILATLGFSRRKIIDRLIAATAIVHGLTLITTDPDDLRDVPDLRLEVWPAQ